MKSILLLMSILILSATIASAHLEETWSQCESRYGKPVSSNKEFGSYEKDGICIRIVFNGSQGFGADDEAANRGMTSHHVEPKDAKAISVEYTKKEANAYFSEQEVKALLAANVGPNAPSPSGVTWEEIKRKRTHEDYLRFDSKATARVHWEYVGGANVAKKVSIRLVADEPIEKGGAKSGDKLDTIEKDF